MRNIFCFAIAALACLASAQDAKVTYSTVAVPVKKAVEDLAQKTGMKIACSPSMDKEIVVLRLKDAPISEVMKRLATVTSGTWTSEGDLLYLSRDTSGRQIEENRLRKEFATKIAASLKKQQEALQKKADAKPSPEEEAIRAQFGYMGGDNDAMTKMAIAIGADELATVPDDGRVVFSSNPTRMQRRLPSNTNAIISEFIVAHNKMAAAAKQEEPAKIDSDENMAAVREFFGAFMKKPEPITSTPAKALVIATRRGMFMGYMLELRLYGADGKMLASGSTSVVTDLPFDPQEFMNDKPKPETEAEKKAKPIELSPVAKELYGAGGMLGRLGGAANAKLSEALLAALSDPVARDPLSFVHSEALMAIAEQRNEQLIANLPDSLMSFFGNIGQKTDLTDVSYLEQITGDDEATVKEENGWLTVVPSNPVEARKERADRVALRDLIQTAKRKGTLSLDDLAAYAVKNDSPMDGAPATSTYIIVFAPNALQQGMMGAMDWDLLRLYGMMGESQRALLRQGRRIEFGSLTPGQQTQLTKMLFGPEEHLAVENPRDPSKPKQDPITEMIQLQMQRVGGQGGGDFRTEPTEIMPNGLPANGYVQVGFSSEPVAQPQTMSTDFGKGMTMGAMELGMLKFMSEDPQMSALSGAIPTIDDLKVGTRSVYEFSFYVAPSVVQHGTLNDDNIPKDARVYKKSDLPADFQKKIEEMAASMKKNPIWKMIGAMGGFRQQAPPP